MNVFSAFILFLGFLAVSETANLFCHYGSENATISISSGTKIPGRTVGVSNISPTIFISCPRDFEYDKYYIYFLKIEENTTSVDYFAYFKVYFYGYIKKYNYHNTYQITSTKFNNTLHEAQVHISLRNLTIADNLSRLAVKQAYSKGIFYSRPLIIYSCPAPLLPVGLISNYDPSLDYIYLDVIRATCRKNFLFINDVYQNSMNIPCGRYLQWEIPKHECAVGCPNPTQGPIQTNPSLPTARYKVNTRLGVSCGNGRKVFSSSEPTMFIQRIICQSNGHWDHANIDCWQDQIVDFTSSKQTLSSDIKTVFACVAEVRSHRVRITVGEFTIQSLNVAWWVSTPDSKWNGIIAICEVIDDNKIVVEKLSTLLNVLYSSELLHTDDDLQFGLDKDKSDHAIIEFNANPALSLIDVKITKNGTQIPNYYLTVKDYSHKVVVDFTEVQDTDFGVYVLSMTSVSPVAQVTKTNFTIFQNIAEQQGFTAVHAAITAIGSILIIALVIVAIFITRRMMNKQETSKATVENDTPDTVMYNVDAVVYDSTVPDHHNYEDIEGKRGDETTGSEGKDGYVDMEIGQPPQQNTYTDERNRTTQPISNNSNQKVAMKPPIRQNRVDRENPYMMPSVARWR